MSARYSPAIADTQRPFDFNANHIALDFVNTVSARPIFVRDDLRGPADVYDWAVAAGLMIDVAEGKQSIDGPAAFQAAISLRERLYEVFGPIAHQLPPEPDALEFVTRRAADAMRRARWIQTDCGLVPQWPGPSLEAIGDRVADEAVTLLRRPALARVGFCAGCGWLFLDTSRGHARRWCSMNACGVRDKMRRYHKRQANVASAR